MDRDTLQSLESTKTIRRNSIALIRDQKCNDHPPACPVEDSNPKIAGEGFFHSILFLSCSPQIRPTSHKIKDKTNASHRVSEDPIVSCHSVILSFCRLNFHACESGLVSSHLVTSPACSICSGIKPPFSIPQCFPVPS